MILVAVAFLRELLGSGQFFGISVIPQFVYDLGFQDMGLMVLAPGAFFYHRPAGLAQEQPARHIPRER